MKKGNYHKRFRVICISLLLFTIYIFVVWKVFIPTWESKNGIFIKYQEMLLSNNKNYIGMIDTDNKKVTIVNHAGKEI